MRLPKLLSMQWKTWIEFWANRTEGAVTSFCVHRFWVSRESGSKRIAIWILKPEGPLLLRNYANGSSEAIGDITVTPDCMARVGHNYSRNNSTLVDNSTLYSVNAAGPSQDVTDDFTVVSRFNEIPNDMPLDHRLPSPEEQCQIIALKFPAELIRVDTSGRRFERMCGARKSMLHVPLNIGEQNNLNDDVQTVKRRSRSRKPRNKRRNTIAGTDQKEIEEAVRGDDDNEPPPSPIDNDDDRIIVPRSKSNNILKKDSPTTDAVKTLARMSHFNTLKQWGRNRLRLINRNSDDNKKEKVSDIDDINVYETVISKNKKKFMEKERKLLHERKPSYSSSEKSLTITSQSSSHSTQPASINPVKLRESSAIRRQRRSWLGHKDELNSSSGNWSASSESGRTSIGSEITAQPKSTASSTSLNHSHHPGSGPPSSIISRRRFLNTSASSSVTSDGTVTPDIQVHDLYDDETSSAYSCDTEGYYTSFHIDSGLKTLKEEEPITPLHTSSALSSTNSFGSSSNKTVLSAENEYELFGKGSTSTTASSAGTVCTTLMTAGSDRCLINGPAVPERKSSLTKLHRSGSNTSNSTLERSYSSSTVGSTLERNGTIKRNGILLKKEIPTKVTGPQSNNRIESPDSGNNTSSSPIETNSNASPTYGGVRSNSEHEHSECSDFEGVERVERIRLTPSNSDDDDTTSTAQKDRKRERHASPVKETELDEIKFNCESASKGKAKVQLMSINKETGYATVNTFEKPTSKAMSEFKKDVQHFKKTTLLPLNNMFGRLRGVLPHLKKSPMKDIATLQQQNDPLYDNTGEYVTIADVTNNNQKKANGGYYSNDLVKRNLATVLSGKLNDETEYVSLNELPSNIRCESNLLSNSLTAPSSKDEKINRNRNEECDSSKDEEGIIKRTARVTLDAHGKVVFNSDSLKRRKGAHTTFLPGPYVKDQSDTNNPNTNVLPTAPIIGGVSNRKLMLVRPVISQSLHKPIANIDQNKQVDKVVIRADSSCSSGTEVVRMPIATVVAASAPNTTQQSQATTSNEMAGSALKGAYVNVQEINRGNGNLLNSTKYRNNELHYTKPGKVIVKRNISNKPSNYPTTSPATSLYSSIKKQNKRLLTSENCCANIEQKVKRSNSYRLANSPIMSLQQSDTKSTHNKNEMTEQSNHQQTIHPHIIHPKAECTITPLLHQQHYQQQQKQQQQHTSHTNNTQKIDRIKQHKVHTPDARSDSLLNNANTTVYQSSPTSVIIEANKENFEERTNASAAVVVVSMLNDASCTARGAFSGGSITLLGKSSSSSTENVVVTTKADVMSSTTYNENVKSIAKSFEKLMDEFSLSTSLDDSSASDSSYLKSKSIENIESSDEFFDSDSESMLPSKSKKLVFYTPSPNKVTIPGDSHNFRARVLSFSGNSSCSTDIW